MYVVPIRTEHHEEYHRYLRGLTVLHRHLLELHRKNVKGAEEEAAQDRLTMLMKKFGDWTVKRYPEAFKRHTSYEATPPQILIYESDEEYAHAVEETAKKEHVALLARINVPKEGVME